MTETANRPCPVCEHHSVETLRRQRFVLEEHHPLSDGYSVVCCKRCGFVYADVSASQADYDAYYAELSKYDDPATSTGSGESALDRERLAGTAEILCSHLPSRDARILDIGCAGGGLLYALRQRGYPHLAGIDPSPACARQTAASTGEAYAGWIMNLPQNIGTFDGVILSHVLEHVLEVSSAIEAIRPLLRDGGRLYIEVPDASRYADHVYAPFQDFNTEHINHFSPKSLDNLMLPRGFARQGGGLRLLRSSIHTLTPALFAVYSNGGSEMAVDPDLDFKPSVLKYIERSTSLLASIDNRIREALPTSAEVIVWGAGQLTLKLLAETCLADANVVAFVDSNPVHQGKRLAGAPVLPPSAISSYSQPLLIGTLLHHREIMVQIERLGLSNRVILLPEGGPKFFETAQ